MRDEGRTCQRCESNSADLTHLDLESPLDDSKRCFRFVTFQSSVTCKGGQRQLLSSQHGDAHGRAVRVQTSLNLAKNAGGLTERVSVKSDVESVAACAARVSGVSDAATLVILSCSIFYSVEQR